MVKQELVVYIKTTNECQLKCEHCYNTISPFKGKMTEEIADKVVKFLVEKSKDHNVLAVFHGGEPLFNGLRILKRIVEPLKDNGDIHFTITTNLMYTITDEHIALFKYFTDSSGNNLISTSWDYKIRFATDAQLKLWENNVRLLFNNGIIVAPIVSVTQYLIDAYTPERLFKYFLTMGIDRINFERITETGRALINHLKPLNKNGNQWLYNAYLKSKEMGIFVPLFNGLEESILNHNKVGCRKRACQRNVITINPDGKIAGCPNCSNKTYGTLDGNIDQTVYDKLVKEEELKNNGCYICELYEYCNGDCFQLKWDESGCPGLKQIIERILNDSKTKS